MDGGRVKKKMNIEHLLKHPHTANPPPKVFDTGRGILENTI
jgi:hypothetical protein